MKNTKTIGLRAAALVAGGALLLSGCGGKVDRTAQGGGEGAAATCEASPGQLTIATGNSTGVYYVLGGGIAALLTEKTPLRTTAAETGASVQNIEQLSNGDYDIAFSLADTASDAVEGKGAFEGKAKEVAALGRIYSNYTHVVVRKDSGIKSMEDMRGKRVSTGSPKSGTEVIATRLLQSAGLNIETDVAAQRLDLTKTTDGMKDGAIDALVWSGGLPTPAITDLFTTGGDQYEFIDVTPQLSKMQEINEVYAEETIPGSTYGLDADIKTIAVPNVLLVRSDMTDNNACAITKTIWSNVEQLKTVHKVAEELDPAKAKESDPIPLHPGSAKALDELG